MKMIYPAQGALNKLKATRKRKGLPTEQHFNYQVFQSLQNLDKGDAVSCLYHGSNIDFKQLDLAKEIVHYRKDDTVVLVFGNSIYEYVPVVLQGFELFDEPSMTIEESTIAICCLSKATWRTMRQALNKYQQQYNAYASKNGVNLVNDKSFHIFQ